MPAYSSRSDNVQRRVRPGWRARALFLKVHLWIGLSLGAVVALVGLTGALLVLIGPIVRAEHGAVLFPEAPPAAQADWAPVEAWIVNARARYPDLGHLDYVAAPGAAPVPSSVPLLVGHVDLPDGAHGHLVVPVDPVRAEPLGRFVFEQTWAGALLMLHVELLAGVTGDRLVAWASLGARVTVTALGTAFTVGLADDRVEVAVAKGRVERRRPPRASASGRAGPRPSTGVAPSPAAA
jgi:uncharacterized iron-regulated membrane protein